MVQLFDAANGASLGSISEEQLRFMLDHLEEEAADDQDYYINRATLDYFAEQGADPTLLELLRKALGEREEMDLRWSR
ncbi:MAG: galactosyldiacylglycerol synthase [Meiothermus sp.]